MAFDDLITRCEQAIQTARDLVQSSLELRRSLKNRCYENDQQKAELLETIMSRKAVQHYSRIPIDEHIEVVESHLAKKPKFSAIIKRNRESRGGGK